ncbi:hypothetical protein [Acanthamoeba castellanii mimivirus]|uniref:Uncharacterized protein n=2 Tax=Mimivirus TaxID=315393 RepID=E3VYP0_MIMIV|nr:hypothetical protein MIMI_gp0553 [Acanthamoeba polyphaga mimivirus]AEQ60708.1 hypothetical protein [Acanthamoeba castellanii mamavirus]AHA45338.1 hypothetical protein HIRU_S432 [Hirudovirus strain Sangsue]QTF49435.1 hypothetical protein [Mimivirus reunion]WMV61878.1 hypothetical protein qu_544 [Mimivirus sp.]BAV61625.1 hypothetical protein [Acanthamoeba castellanii mimivirus]
MNPDFNDEQTRQLLAQQQHPMQPVQPVQPVNKGGFTDYLRNHKLIVLLIIIVLAFLLWWFFFRKPKHTGDLGASVANKTSAFNISKNRNASFL